MDSYSQSDLDLPGEPENGRAKEHVGDEADEEEKQDDGTMDIDEDRLDPHDEVKIGRLHFNFHPHDFYRPKESKAWRHYLQLILLVRDGDLDVQVTEGMRCLLACARRTAPASHESEIARITELIANRGRKGKFCDPIWQLLYPGTPVPSRWQQTRPKRKDPRRAEETWAEEEEEVRDRGRSEEEERQAMHRAERETRLADWVKWQATNAPVPRRRRGRRLKSEGPVVKAPKRPQGRPSKRHCLGTLASVPCAEVAKQAGAASLPGGSAGAGASRASGSGQGTCRNGRSSSSSASSSSTPTGLALYRVPYWERGRKAKGPQLTPLETVRAAWAEVEPKRSAKPFLWPKDGGFDDVEAWARLDEEERRLEGPRADPEEPRVKEEQAGARFDEDPEEPKAKERPAKAASLCLALKDEILRAQARGLVLTPELETLRLEQEVELPPQAAEVPSGAAESGPPAANPAGAPCSSAEPARAPTSAAKKNGMFQRTLGGKQDGVITLE